ncbi:MAG TPA: hypothetical protein PLG50_14970, partial [bacterium]|nr:hypothetical protein [bacterium]
PPPPCHAAWQESGPEGDAAEDWLLRSRAALTQALQGFYWDTAGQGQTDAAEIAWSWLGDQAAPVPGVDLRKSASPAETVRLIEEYRLRLTDWQDQVIFT